MHSNQGIQAQFRSSVQKANARMGARMQNGAPLLSASNLISALIGLGIGLFLAWQVWPVNWVGARPADLDPDAKAQYLASVADAYIAAGEDANALILASRRLAGMDLATAIPNAVSYFQQGAQGNTLAQTDASTDEVFTATDAYQQNMQSDGNIRISYLLRLAAGLGMNVQAPSVANAAPVNSTSGEASVSNSGSDAALPPAVDGNALDNNSTSQSAAAADSTTQLNTSDTFRLLLSGLTSLLLVLGGIYILLHLARANNWLPFFRQGASATSGATGGVPPAESMSERELISTYSQQPLEVQPFDEDDLSLDEPIQVRPGRRSSDAHGFDQASATGYQRRASEEAVRSAGFERHEDDDDAYAAGPNDERSRDEYTHNYRYAESDPVRDDYAEDNPEQDAADFMDPERDAGYHRPAAGPALREERASYANRPGADARGDLDDGWEDEDEEADDPDVSSIMEQYITHYEQGVLDYEERRHIMSDTESPGSSLGEYGIGVNYKNGILGTDASQVIAMDLWLFDKTDDKNAVYQTQVLLSERANQLDELKEALESDQAGSKPILPYEGLTFQLAGKNLLLDCEILLVEFTDDEEASGIFDALEVQLTLHSKAAS